MLPINLAGKRIADDLDAAERLANESLRANAQLLLSMMNARIDSDLAPYDGQLAVSRVQQAIQQIVEAQNNLAKAHKSMRAEFIEITGVGDENRRCPMGSSGIGDTSVAA